MTGVDWEEQARTWRGLLIEIDFEVERLRAALIELYNGVANGTLTGQALIDWQDSHSALFEDGQLRDIPTKENGPA